MASERTEVAKSPKRAPENSSTKRNPSHTPLTNLVLEVLNASNFKHQSKRLVPFSPFFPPVHHDKTRLQPIASAFPYHDFVLAISGYPVDLLRNPFDVPGCPESSVERPPHWGRFRRLRA